MVFEAQVNRLKRKLLVKNEKKKKEKRKYTHGKTNKIE